MNDSVRGQHTYQEILSQKQSWTTTLASVKEQAAPLQDWLRANRAETHFIGCGSTYYLSRGAASLWQHLTGGRAGASPSSEIWLFPGANLPKASALLVAISRSAETTETLRAIELFKSQVSPDVLCITCYQGREMTSLSTHSLFCANAEEISLAQTRSFSSMWLTAQYTAGLTAGNEAFLSELEKLPAALDPLFSAYEPLAKSLAEDPQIEQFIFLGSGPNYALACEAMLKMKEMSLSLSEAFHFMEFRHGPKSVVDSKTLVVGLLSDSQREKEEAVLRELRQLGAKVLALGEGAPPGQETADQYVDLKSGVGEYARGPLLLPVLQLMAYYRSMHKGLNPDLPENLSAVVYL